MGRRAVFFDRDGVLNQAVVKDGKAYAPQNLAEFAVHPQAPGIVAALAGEKYFIFVVTNQPDIARKKITRAEVDRMNQKLVETLGGPALVKEVYVCPHDNQDQCPCRKPKPGMLLAAAGKWGLDLKHSFLVGDREVDVQAGKSAGVKTVLLATSYNQESSADYRARDLDDALQWIRHES